MDNIESVIKQHPKYYAHFLRTHQYLLQGNGPLSSQDRYVLAILAAGRHKCCCLIKFYKDLFLQNDSEPSESTWMEGFEYLPQKFQNLNEVNKFLAHRPWLVETSHIKDLLTGDNKWTLAELTQAIILLIHFHALSSFLFACGVNSGAVVHDCNETISMDAFANATTSDDNQSEPEVNAETLVGRILNVSRSSSSSSINISQDELRQRFEAVERQLAEIPAPRRDDPVINTDIIDDPTFAYEDFAQRGRVNRASTFRFNDFSWTEKGCSILNKLYVSGSAGEGYEGVGDMLDEKFKAAYKLTYNTIAGCQNVETYVYRRAIWNYILCLYGIRKDDYDYNEVNQLLDRQLKTFIKNSVCYPEQVTLKDMKIAVAHLQPSEKIHLNILIMEARIQGELLYATRALSNYWAEDSRNSEN